ncbi:unnamed protein product [Orchesella dallaii]|uniref:C-type lectin domain-containing protein n=1 Tax=Orchesella dallaii TaxID=48710 RepID=A0ABP1QCL5_9HEXA
MIFKNPLLFMVLMVSAVRPSNEAPTEPLRDIPYGSWDVSIFATEVTFDEANNLCESHRAVLWNPSNLQQTEGVLRVFTDNFNVDTQMDFWTLSITREQDPPVGEGTVTHLNIENGTFTSNFAPITNRHDVACLKPQICYEKLCVKKKQVVR